MKIKLLATGSAPTHYSFEGELVTAYYDGKSEVFDLSSIEFGDEFVDISVDELNLHGFHVIRDAYRDSVGELHITLCQQVGPGHWSESDEMDSTDYNPKSVYAVYDKNRQHADVPWVITSEGKLWVK